MKITYNTDRFPLVKVFFNDDPDPKNKYYDDFMNYWEENYKKKQYFKFLMDLTNLTKPNLLKLKDFMSRLVKLKNNKETYLKYSVLVTDNLIVSGTLNFLWRIHPPLNTVYMASTILIAESLIKLLDQNANDAILTLFMFENNITKILPN
tara:strand:- start:2185 stop:2634 length:450 start_codon:yes stop_codon:yes gene_type:complete